MKSLGLVQNEKSMSNLLAFFLFVEFTLGVMLRESALSLKRCKYEVQQQKPIVMCPFCRKL